MRVIECSNPARSLRHIDYIVAVESDLKTMLPDMQAYTHTNAKLQHMTIYPHTYENDDAK